MSSPQEAKTAFHRALFLDRDGVINADHGYVYRWEEFVFLPGIFDLCRQARDEGFAIVVITNQAGIGRGYYTADDFEALTGWMKERFLDEGVTIAAVYHCPDHPEAGIGPYRRDSFDRKPNPGMLLRARDDLSIDLARSILVGDKESDIEAAMRAGVGISIRFGRLAAGETTRADLNTDDFAEVCRLLGCHARQSPS